MAVIIEGKGSSCRVALSHVHILAVLLHVAALLLRLLQC